MYQGNIYVVVVGKEYVISSNTRSSEVIVYHTSNYMYVIPFGDLLSNLVCYGLSVENLRANYLKDLVHF